MKCVELSSPKLPPFEMNLVSLRSVEAGQRRLPGTSPTHCSSAPLVSPKVSVPQAPETKTLPARLADAPPWPPRGIVGADRGAEGDAAVGRSGHVDAEADAGDGAQVVGESPSASGSGPPSLLML